MRYIFGKGVGYAFKGSGLMTRFQGGNILVFNGKDTDSLLKPPEETSLVNVLTLAP